MDTRLVLTLEAVKRELLQAKLQAKIRDDVEEKINKSRRTALLYEQLKAIKKELGITKDDKDAVADEYMKRLEDKDVPQEIMKVIDSEMNKLKSLEPSSSEFNVTSSYLDWLTCIPWNVFSEESFDIHNAKEVLDRDHYGMKDVKDRILEFIAVGALKKQTHGKILCFAGPPGVGKTSIAKSIAEALNRKYYRFSVGGLSDVAEIKGHRRTYVGAMPGKAIQCLKLVQAQNPLILIDEIDKISTGVRGDPTSALLELLDPAQNSTFNDYYLDVPVDMSKVLFVCTANNLDTIPGPLLDRMEIVELSGYLAEEKRNIAQKYLLPTALKETGIDKTKITITDEAIDSLIQGYCRESGVRHLQKKIEQILRKAAFKFVSDPSLTFLEISTRNLHEFVGQPIFTSDRMFDVTPPGVVMGLAWTSMGGSALYIESLVTRQPKSDDSKTSRGTASFKVTGHLGDVMKESSTIAYTYAKHYLSHHQPDNLFFSDAEVSLHVPEGATPKDGPSAGVTMVTALLSLARDVPIKQNLAMTGEISLTGKVLRVGGIKEKLLAARRANATTVILPAGNKPDYEELPDTVKEGLEVEFANTYDDVYKVAFSE